MSLELGQHASCRNLLLRTMLPADFSLLVPLISFIRFDVDEVLAVPGQPIDAAYFPETGIITLSEYTRGGMRIGIGHTGYEGCANWSVLLGSQIALHEARMTAIGGSAHRIAAADLIAACRASASLNSLMLRFVRAFTMQMSHTIVSSLTQPVETRLCRWTLMAHDRIEGDEILVTHHEIAVMLAIRRASVTDALHILEGERLIRCDRRRVRVLDREGLRKRAGHTYGRAEAEFSRLISPFPATKNAGVTLGSH